MLFYVNECSLINGGKYGIEAGIITSVILAVTLICIFVIMQKRGRVESGSVWNSAVVYAIWNIVIIGGELFIGDKADEYSVTTYVLDPKSFQVTGGEFGIESSIISLTGYIIVTIIAIVMMRRDKT